MQHRQYALACHQTPTKRKIYKNHTVSNFGRSLVCFFSTSIYYSTIIDNARIDYHYSPYCYWWFGEWSERTICCSGPLLMLVLCTCTHLILGSGTPHCAMFTTFWLAVAGTAVFFAAICATATGQSVLDLVFDDLGNAVQVCRRRLS